MTYATNRWHVLINGEKVAEFAHIEHAERFAAAYRATLRAARRQEKLDRTTVGGFSR